MNATRTYGNSAMNHLWEYLQGLPMSAREQRWLADRLNESADKEEPVELKRYTMEDIKAMLEEAEANFAAGRGIPDEEVWREWDKEHGLVEKEEYAMADAV